MALHSQRDLEGCLEINHRDSPGMSEVPQDAHRFVAVPAGTVVKMPTMPCCHCGCVVIANPNRARVRHKCAYCGYRYVCDKAECVMMAEGVIKHQSLEELFDELEAQICRAH